MFGGGVFVLPLAQHSGFVLLDAATQLVRKTDLATKIFLLFH